MLILPFGFIHDLRYWTVPVMVIVFYAFVGLEVIGEEIEDPFGKDANDLKTDEISNNIRKNVKEIFGVV
jgi:putative membrane protein